MFNGLFLILDASWFLLGLMAGKFVFMTVMMVLFILQFQLFLKEISVYKGWEQ